MDTGNSQGKFLSAQSILLEDTTSVEKLKTIKELVYGDNHNVDKGFEKCTKALDTILKLQEGDVVALTIGNLPEGTEKDKKRKKALLLLIRNLKDLKGEVDRTYSELSSDDGETKSLKQQTRTFGRIFAFSKGPFAIVTMVAVVIVVVYLILGSQAEPKHQALTSISPSPEPKAKIQYIAYNGKQIALSETIKLVGRECERDEHYHAKDHVSVKAIDNTVVMGHGGCGFGKVKDTPLLEKWF